MSNPVDEDRLGGSAGGVFAGALDEFAGLEAGAGERDPQIDAAAQSDAFPAVPGLVVRRVITQIEVAM